MDDTEALLCEVVGALSPGGVLVVDGRSIELQRPFARCTVAQAFERFAGVPGDEALRLANEDPDRFFFLLVDQVEPAIAQLPAPLFLTEFPAPFASLARLKASDPRVCERFELYVGGLELCNGFGELTCPEEQRARLVRDQEARRAEGKPVYPIDEAFLQALEEGMPPSAGNALGFDRLVALALGARHLAQVLSFPEGWL